MIKSPHIYLASRSPRRGELLRQIGGAFEVLPADVDESILAGEAPEHYVLRLSRATKRAVPAFRGRPAYSSAASRAVIQASWGCRCTKRHTCLKNLESTHCD